MEWVYTGFPVLVWASGVDGVATIYSTGTQIPTSSLAAVIAAAAVANVPLSVGTPPPGGVIYSPALYLTEAQANTLYANGSSTPPSAVDGGNATAN